MSVTIKVIIAGIITWINCAFIFWLSGDNFDHRGEDISSWYSGTCLISLFVMFITRCVIGCMESE
jgi:hypothetical protein